jgi:aryl-alcohol dehydrogenase-like predicted oxidoreductase
MDPQGGPKWVERACVESLRRLGSDYIDLYLRPRRESVVITTKFGMREPPEGLSGGHPRACPRSVSEAPSP